MALLFNASIFLLALNILLASCQTITPPQNPDNLISEDLMVEIMTDIHLFTSAKGINRLQLQKTGLTPHQLIFEKHQIDSLQYAQSNTYYGAHLETYERIHLRVKTILEMKKEEVDTALTIEKRVQDNLIKTTDSLKKRTLDTIKKTELRILSSSSSLKEK